MGLETGTFIDDLVATNPVGAVDNYATADDHLRLIKTILKSQFGSLGAAAVNATAADLNLVAGAAVAGLTAAEILYLNGVTSDIQTQITAAAASPSIAGLVPNTVQVIAGTNLTGGGALTGNVTLNLDPTYDPVPEHDALVGFVAAEHIDWSITGVEDIHADRVVIPAVDHNATTNYVADEHIAHASVTITAGNGLSGGGTIAATRSIDLDVDTLSAFTGEIAATDEFIINDGGVEKRVAYQDTATPVNVQTGTTYAPVLGDANKIITLDNAAAITVTIPANASVAYPIGTIITVLQKGAGQVTVGITTDTLSGANGFKLIGQYAAANLIKIAATVWVMSGSTEV